MSTESAQQFLEKMGTDPTFRAAIENAPTDAERQDIVKKAGFEFTKAELQEVIPDNFKSGELSEAELENVAGGKSAAWIATSLAAGGAVVAAAA